ncbi:hypothetical protein [Methylobacter sp.]|uniref:hypothetical protein n=1 Tax=Methylobacter sp. TaxID=2051955 RepID=UPI0012189C4F|nr:hypothetical protein [Methylobacter sp.]TAK61074.1 MAG: hypothetical protein EPO18_15235 [Methylobacter sp.]
MTTQAMEIKSEENAWEFISQALEGVYDNEVIELKFENWPILAINIKGQRYDSTLPSSLMRSLVDFQGHLNRVYAEVIYGKTAKSLTTEERAALEIEKGSSDIFADLSGFFTELGKNAMDKMTGRQVVAIVLGSAVLYTASSKFDSYLEFKKESEAENNRHAITMQLMQQQPKLLEIQNETAANLTNILKAVPDADKVKLNNTTLSKAHIEAITKQDRQPTELKRIDDEYLISSLKIKSDSYRIEIIRMSDGKSIPTELLKGHLGINEMDSIMKAFTTEKPILLNVVGRVKGEVITTANIVGVKNVANGSTLGAVIPTFKLGVDYPSLANNTQALPDDSK